MTSPLDIGEVIERTGVVASTLHLWERRGLIAPIGRAGIRRQYDQTVLSKIATIVLCQRSGFSLAEIAAVLNNEAFENDKAMLREKLAELQEMQASLATAINGVEHALNCSFPSPLECPGFQKHLADVLPVERTPST